MLSISALPPIAATARWPSFARPSCSRAAITNPACCSWDRSLPQIATGDLDIAIVRQLSPSNLPLCDEFEAGPVKMVGFKTAFGRGRLRKQDLENASGNAHYTLILSHPDAKLDDGALRIPSGVRREAEEHGREGCSANVLRRKSHRSVLVSSPPLVGYGTAIRSLRDPRSCSLAQADDGGEL